MERDKPRRIALRKAEWVVYAKRPFGGPEAVLAYLSRYSHRVAIANSRLIAVDEGSVTFKWKDYRTADSSATSPRRETGAELLAQNTK